LRWRIFYGKLDDFAIWKRALSAAEIWEIYSAGCNTGSGFSCSQTNVCEKFCIDFFDSSTNNPTSWQWIFEGGNPPTSTDPNPSNICYDDAGVYDVTLITSNAAGNDTLVLTDFITVYTNPLAPVITQNGNITHLF
jgi:PKD repeat protein